MDSSTQIAPFIVAAAGVFRDLFDMEIRNGQPQQEGDSFISQGFTVMVGLTDGWQGWFLLDMSQETIMKLAGIMTGETYSSLEDEEVLLAGAEIGNIISGNAITEINNKQKGLNIRLAPPSVFAGDGLNMFNVRLNSWSVLLDSDAGPIKINVAAREGK